MLLEQKLLLDIRKNKEYKVKTIKNSIVYIKIAEDKLSGLYYLIFSKNYPLNESTLEPASVVTHLWKIINIFCKDYLKYPTATFFPLDSAPFMARLMVKPNTKQKYCKNRSTKSVKKTKKA